jgi:hypothetical protein
VNKKTNSGFLSKSLHSFRNSLFLEDEITAKCFFDISIVIMFPIF